MSVESAVEPTKSANITVTWRRSAVSWVFGSVTATGIEEEPSPERTRAKAPADLRNCTGKTQGHLFSVERNFF
jgi:hypothetical protein